MHTPVLLQQTIDALEIVSGGRYIDSTYGLGGHSGEIVKRGGEVLAIDWDEESLEFKIQSSELSKKIKLVQGNFANIEKIAKENDFIPVDGVLFDLGISMEQIGRSGRGFSYRKTEEPLDMRISKELEITAADIINSFSEEELYEIFTRNAEELNSRAIAHALVRSRRVKRIDTVGDLVSIINLSAKGADKEGVLRRIFQALRIEVNNEFSNLKKGLTGALKVVKKGGRIAVLTFHPTEDRIVKQFMRTYDLQIVFNKPVTTDSDLAFERSAKLRVAII